MKFKLGQSFTEEEWLSWTEEDYELMEKNGVMRCLGFMKMMPFDEVEEEHDWELSNSWVVDMEALNSFDLLWYAWMNSGSASIDEVLCEAHRDVCRMSRKEWNEWVDEMDKRKIDFTITKQEVIE